jgi:hypothetical protein
MWALLSLGHVWMIKSFQAKEVNMLESSVNKFRNKKGTKDLNFEKGQHLDIE